MEFSKKMLVLHSFVTVSLITATVVINIATEHDVTALAALAGTSFVVDGTWGGYQGNPRMKTGRNMPKNLYGCLPKSTAWRTPSAWQKSC